MYAPQQLIRVNHDEWLRYAETRRLIKQAALSSGAAPRTRRRLRIRRPALNLGRPLRHA